MPPTLSRQFYDYAVGDGIGVTPYGSCVVASIVEDFNATDQSFSALLKSVATSNGFATRAKGRDQ